MRISRSMAALVATLLATALHATGLPATALSQESVRVRRIGGRCGQTVDRRQVQPPATAAARSPRPGTVVVSLDRFPFYCAPAPEFDAMVREDGTLELRAREPEAPVARCTCPHAVRLRLDGVPAGSHPVEVRFRDDVIARRHVDVGRAR